MPAASAAGGARLPHQEQQQKGTYPPAPRCVSSVGDLSVFCPSQRSVVAHVSNDPIRPGFGINTRLD